jgi:hypothetical protein
MTWKSAAAKKLTCLFLIQSRNEPLRIKDDFAFALGCPTVCVTRAGAGGGTPSDWKNDKA